MKIPLITLKILLSHQMLFFLLNMILKCMKKRVLRPVAAMFYKRLAVVYLLLSYRLCSAKYTSSFYALYTVLKKSGVLINAMLEIL